MSTLKNAAPASRTLALVGAMFTLTLMSSPATAAPEARFYTPYNVSGSSGLSFNPALAVDAGGAVFAAWNDNTWGNMEVMMSRSLDQGKTWSAPLNLSNNAGLSTFPAMAVTPDGKIHVVFQDNDGSQSAVYYSQSLDRGVSFSTPLKLSPANTVSVNADVVSDSSGNLYVSFSTETALYVARSSDGGATFTSRNQFRLKTWAATQLATGRNNSLHLVWNDRGDILYSNSLDGGKRYSNARNLSASAGNSKSPALGADNLGNVFVAWSEEGSNNSEILLTKSSDNGTSFAKAKDMTANSGASIEPDLHVDARNNVHLVWQDTTPGNYEAVYMISDDAGSTFSPMTLVSPSELGSLITKVKADNQGNIYVAWDDNRNGNFETVVARGRTDIAAITASVTPSLFSPNGDGIDDSTVFNGTFTEWLEWTLSVKNESAVETARFSGSGTAFEQTWNGLDAALKALPDGLYSWEIGGLDSDGYEAISTVGMLEIDTGSVALPPQISSLEATPYLDPDGDGRRDTAVLTASFNKTVTWTATITNSQGTAVYTLTGTGSDMNAEWNGIDGNSGLVVPDGDYTLTLGVTDATGGSATATALIRVDSSDPQWSNLVYTTSFSPDGDGINDVATIDFDISEGALVTVYVFEAASGSLVNELFRYAYAAPSHVTVTWNGLSGGGQELSPGTYQYSIWVRDYAANRANPYPIRAEVTIE